MECEMDRELDANDEEFTKRRSSILKPRDDTTKFQTQRRRVSFHNMRKVQEYDKDNGDLRKEQEEQLHLTSNSDNLKSDTMSTSFVTGANFGDPDASMTLTFLHGPQAASTPAVCQHLVSKRRTTKTITNADTTINVFANVAANNAGELLELRHRHETTTTVESDKTFVVFSNLDGGGKQTKTVPPMATEDKENLPATNFNDDGMTLALFAEFEGEKSVAAAKQQKPTVEVTDDFTGRIFTGLASVEEPTKPPADVLNTIGDSPQPAADEEESRWSNAFCNNNSSTRMSPGNVTPKDLRSPAPKLQKTMRASTEKSFNEVIVDIDEKEMATARRLHERKQRVYRAIETLLAKAGELTKEEARLDAELSAAFQDLIGKIRV